MTLVRQGSKQKLKKIHALSYHTQVYEFANQLAILTCWRQEPSEIPAW